MNYDRDKCGHQPDWEEKPAALAARELDEYIGAELYRQQRDWLIEECDRVGVTVNVLIGAPLEKAYRLVNTRCAQLEEAMSALRDIKSLLGGEYSITRSDGGTIDLPEAIRIGNIFERADKALGELAVNKQA